MSSTSITLLTLPRGTPIKKLPQEVCLPRQSPTSEIYQFLARAADISIHRLRLTKGSDGQLIPASQDVAIESTGLMDGSKIYVKDLGPQIAWQTVFLIEYFGPLLIHPLIYLLRPYIYPSPNAVIFPAPSTVQTLSLGLILIHYLKREMETLFVHRFSSATMPFRNVFKNSFHYWALGGLNLAYWIYSPTAPAAKATTPFLTYLGLLLFAIGEAGNLNAHLMLRKLRSSGGKERGIPRGLGFETVTCPNYMFETMAWVGMILITRSLATILFAIASSGQMAIWAKKKERNYRREFGDRYKKKRFCFIPGVY